MSLNALVMSRSHASIRVLISAFAELGIEYQISSSASEAADVLAHSYHSALIVDFDLPHSVQIAQAARVTPTRRPVIFGMIGAGTSIESAFLAGSNFVLYKPLDLLQALHSLRAAQGFMRSGHMQPSRQQRAAVACL
jgi:CheY-like chemotaxis protein